MNTLEEEIRPAVSKKIVDKRVVPKHTENKQISIDPPLLKNVRIDDSDASFTDEFSKNLNTSLALSDLISFDSSLVEPVEVHSLSLGAQLREARNRTGLTIEAVARNTCISRHFLHALEQNQWDSLPPIVYCRGYLR
ncbi:MAG: helix-turn-helix domain-containing protein, partial [Pseudomonadota bacterium]